MDENPASILTEFVMENLPLVPVRRRIQVTRALAALSNGEEREALLSIAAQCEAVERAHQQLLLDFRRKKDGGES